MATNGRRLIDAASAGDLAEVRLALAAGANVNANHVPLRVAAAYGHVDVVRALIAAGADVHAEIGVALRLAAYHGHVDVLEALIVAGADVGASGDYAINWAAAHGHHRAVRMLPARTFMQKTSPPCAVLHVMGTMGL